MPSRTTSVARADQSASTSRDSPARGRASCPAAAGPGRCPEIRACTTRSPASTCTRSPGVAGERGQEQRGVHGGVEARGVADPAGAGARGVEHDDHAAVLLGLPGAHDEVLAPGGGPPVDRAHVVALDVLAQAVELGALAADAHRRPAVELAQPRQPAGQVLAGGERRAAPGPTRAPGPTAAARPARAGRARARSPGRRAGRRAGWARGGCVRRTRSCGRHGELVHGIHRAGRRAATRRGAAPRTPRPGGVGDPQAGRRRSRRAAPGSGSPRTMLSASGPAGEQHVEGHEPRRRAAATSRTVDPCGHTATGTSPSRSQHAARQVMAISGGRAPSRARLSSTAPTPTPSSSASGRSESRWARVAWASALTSSGVTKSRPASQAQARPVASARWRRAG